MSARLHREQALFSQIMSFALSLSKNACSLQLVVVSFPTSLGSCREGTLVCRRAVCVLGPQQEPSVIHVAAH